MIQSLFPLLLLLLPHGDAAPREVANPEDNELDSGPRKPGRYDWKEKYANYDKEQHEKLMKKYASLPYTVTKELKEGLEERQYPIANWESRDVFLAWEASNPPRAQRGGGLSQGNTTPQYCHQEGGRLHGQHEMDDGGWGAGQAGGWAGHQRPRRQALHGWV